MPGAEPPCSPLSSVKYFRGRRSFSLTYSPNPFRIKVNNLCHNKLLIRPLFRSPFNIRDIHSSYRFYVHPRAPVTLRLCFHRQVRHTHHCFRKDSYCQSSPTRVPEVMQHVNHPVAPPHAPACRGPWHNGDEAPVFTKIFTKIAPKRAGCLAGSPPCFHGRKENKTGSGTSENRKCVPEPRSMHVLIHRCRVPCRNTGFLLLSRG